VSRLSVFSSNEDKNVGKRETVIPQILLHNSFSATLIATPINPPWFEASNIFSTSPLLYSPTSSSTSPHSILLQSSSFGGSLGEDVGSGTGEGLTDKNPYLPTSSKVSTNDDDNTTNNNNNNINNNDDNNNLPNFGIEELNAGVALDPQRETDAFYQYSSIIPNPHNSLNVKICVISSNSSDSTSYTIGVEDAKEKYSRSFAPFVFNYLKTTKILPKGKSRSKNEKDEKDLYDWAVDFLKKETDAALRTKSKIEMAESNRPLTEERSLGIAEFEITKLPILKKAVGGAIGKVESLTTDPNSEYSKLMKAVSEFPILKDLPGGGNLKPSRMSLPPNAKEVTKLDLCLLHYQTLGLNMDSLRKAHSQKDDNGEDELISCCWGMIKGAINQAAEYNQFDEKCLIWNACPVQLPFGTVISDYLSAENVEKVFEMKKRADLEILACIEGLRTCWSVCSRDLVKSYLGDETFAA
jgi:hypothetical protein